MTNTTLAPHPIFIEDPEFDWTTSVSLPENDRWHNIDIPLRFRLISAEELSALLDQPSTKLFQRIIVHIGGHNGPLAKEQQQRLLGYYPVQKAIIHAYQQAIVGEHEKN